MKTESKDKEPGKYENVLQIIFDKETEEVITSFQDQFGQLYVFIRENNHANLFKLNENGRFNGWLADKYWILYGEGVSKGTIANVLNQYINRCLEKGKIYLHNRVCSNNGNINIDMSDSGWNVIEISGNGWMVKTNLIPMFVRYSHHLPMIVTKIDTSFNPSGNFNKISKYLHASNSNDAYMMKCYILSCLIPDIQHPIMSLYGEKGSAKSFIHTIIKLTIDPSSMETFDVPKDKVEIIQLLQHHWFAPLDNLSGIDINVSNLLCRAVTGSSFSKRTLFSDDDDTIYSYKRCVGLNGVNIVPWATDLLDRCINFNIEKFKFEEQKPEEELKDKFKEEYNDIMNGAFDVISKAMNEVKHIKNKEVCMFRLMDFAKWGEAISRAMGNEKGKFVKAYNDKMAESDRIAVEENMVGKAVLKIMKHQDTFKGRMHELLVVIKRKYEEDPDDDLPAKFPENGTVLSKELNKVIYNFRKLGIEIEKPRWDGDNINIRKFV